MPLDGSATKACAKCGEVKSTADFWLDRRAPGGLVSSCKICAAENRKKYVNPEMKARWYATRRSQSKIAVDCLTCAGCAEQKPEADFNKLCTSPTGRNPKCKVCMCAYQSAYYRSDEDRRRRVIDKACTENRRKKYGITSDQYESMLLAQGRKCACCRTDFDGSKFSKIGNVDHNHETGAVRGLLCSPCNTGIGLLGDNVAGIAAALAYLQRNGAAQ